MILDAFGGVRPSSDPYVQSSPFSTDTTKNHVPRYGSDRNHNCITTLLRIFQLHAPSIYLAKMTMGTSDVGSIGTALSSGMPITRGVEYRCGDCGARNVIKGGDPVRCRQCGFRILYKIRTKRCKFFHNERGLNDFCEDI